MPVVVLPLILLLVTRFHMFGSHVSRLLMAWLLFITGLLFIAGLFSICLLLSVVLLFIPRPLFRQLVIIIALRSMIVHMFVLTSIAMRIFHSVGHISMLWYIVFIIALTVFCIRVAWNFRY